MRKIQCDRCGHEISKNVENAFEQFECGNLLCPHCKKMQKRYLSEADLLIYFGFSAIFYCFLILSIFLLFGSLGFSIVSIVLILGLFCFGWFFMKWWARQIYVKAFFRQDIKEKVIEEDRPAVQKRMKWQFIMFMLVALMMSYQPDLFLPFLFLILAFIVIVFIKVRLAIKNERNQ